MPYTPPSQRSPASTHPHSPTLSRNHSYAEQANPSPVVVTRPSLPRSISSTSYLNKHRRTPSISTNNGQTSNGELTSSPMDTREHHSLRSANGAITTPPDSSDDEERGRELGNLEDLHVALQGIDVKRAGSPVRDEPIPVPPTSVPMFDPPPRALTPEARKISHSRSSSEITLSQHVPHLDTEATLISSSDDSDDDELRIKPPLLRKKSGELVKPALRPTSRRRPSSMPGTPTFSKAVHFNEDMEQVRHFLQVDRPIAVSANSSPVETYDSESEYPFGYEDSPKSRPVEWEIRLANFPEETYERKTMPVRVERIFLSSDNKTLVGSAAVANISFQKWVVARFTLDYWKTTSEVVAEYNNDVRKKQINDGYDRFNFNIKLADQANLETKTLLLCVRYNVNGQEFWDSNNSMNFQVDFTKKSVPRGKGAKKGPSAGTLGAIPRSRHSPPATRPRSMPAAFDDDFGNGFDTKYEFGSTRSIIGDSPNSTIRLKPKSKNRANFFPDPVARNATGASHAFSTRYDFGASLTAALSNAQTALGEKSGLKGTAPSKPTGFFDNAVTGGTRPTSVPRAPVPGTRPDALQSEKPDLQSAEYNELIQKFCFFGTPSGKGSPQVASPATKNTHTDGASDYILEYSSGSNQNSGSSSPGSPEAGKDMHSLVDGANDSKYSSKSPTHFLSRSSSPGPMTGSDPGDRTTSPLYYGGSPYNHNALGGIFAEPSHTPQACV
ncbi:hypothetical protein BU16DRAFT_311409 [Lophium mytilinum]|uniref:CBM21 domain-containing protein n=1 Tax=Lophium mytilinum TaxID=390894 RepID=A0A6A6QY23_9PEZI|nr:hypothetical protein BU16DRAFT_311409 [Lophium mytilinum]